MSMSSLVMFADFYSFFPSSRKGELREHLLDRFAIGLSADSTPLSVSGEFIKNT